MKKRLVPGVGFQKAQETGVAPKPTRGAYGRDLAEEGYVYFFLSSDCEAMKIGFAVNPEQRLANFRTACPGYIDWEDIYPGTRADEITLHELLAAHRIEREWFSFNGIGEFLEDLQDARIALNLERFGDPNRNDIPISELLGERMQDEDG